MMNNATVLRNHVVRLSDARFEEIAGFIIINARITCRPRGSEGERV